MTLRIRILTFLAIMVKLAVVIYAYTQGASPHLWRSNWKYVISAWSVFGGGISSGFLLGWREVRWLHRKIHLRIIIKPPYRVEDREEGLRRAVME